MYWKDKPKKRTVSIIAAVSENNIIGKENSMPWYVPSDLIRFKEITNGHNLIMGSHTYHSILDTLGTPLPNRNSIVLSRKMKLPPFGVVSVARDWTQAFEFARGTGEIFIIGGAYIWKQALTMDIVDKLYLTTIHTSVDGDVYFPDWNKELWISTYRSPFKMKHHQKDEHTSTFEIFERRR